MMRSWKLRGTPGVVLRQVHLLCNHSLTIHAHLMHAVSLEDAIAIVSIFPRTRDPTFTRHIT